MSQSFAEALGWVIKSPNLVGTLERALNYAFKQQHRQVTLDHILLALSEDSDALVVLQASDVNIQKLRNAVSDLIGRNEDRAVPPDLGGPSASSELITIFEYTSAAAEQSGRGAIDGAIVLAALIGEGSSPAARLLEAHGLTFEHAISSLQKRASAAPGEPELDITTELDASTPVENNPAMADAPRADTQFARVDKPGPASDQAILSTPAAGSPPQPQPSAQDVPTPFAPPAPPPAPAPNQSPGVGPNGNHHPGTAPQTGRPGLNPNTGSPAPRPINHEGTAGGDRIGAAPRQRYNDQYDGSMPPWLDPATTAPPPAPLPPQQPHARYMDPGGMRGRAAPIPPNGTAPANYGQPAPSSPGAAHVQPSAVVEEGQMIENIPRRMRVAIPEQVEVRIARHSVDVPVSNMRGRGAPQTHGVYVTKAMTVRLRAPEGGVRIETSSPETQWIDNALDLIQDDFASWRWTVTPERRGITRLQLVASARTVGADGVAAETALPDQVFDVAIRMNYFLTAKRTTGWAAAMAAGGVVAAFGEDAYSKILALVDKI